MSGQLPPRRFPSWMMESETDVARRYERDQRMVRRVICLSVLLLVLQLAGLGAQALATLAARSTAERLAYVEQRLSELEGARTTQQPGLQGSAPQSSPIARSSAAPTSEALRPSQCCGEGVRP